MTTFYAITAGLSLGLLVSHPLHAVALFALVWIGSRYVNN